MSETFLGSVGPTINESTPWWGPRPTPPNGAPNVVLIVLDDTGFAHLGCYGSDIETPNINRLADNGLRFTNFHTTALCSPSRAALLSGRNHHSVGMRFLSNTDTGFSNCRGVISPSAGIIPEVLQANGYATFALGKWHLANMEDCSPSGPMTHWPLGRGFDRFYGFLGGATDQYSPELVIDNRMAAQPSDPNYHLSEAMVDQSMSMITSHRSTSQRPFLAYLAFGATHSPHQAPPSYIEKYRGRYDRGWDVIRAEWFERQKGLGIVPTDAKLAERNPGVPAWGELSDDKRRLAARMQEAFAGFLDHTDAQIGRLLAFLERTGELDSTMVILLSDNGASSEGGNTGVLNELARQNGIRSDVDDMLAQIDLIGGPNFYNNYPKGWAQVGNCPLRHYKSNTYEGGIRDPLIVHWPKKIPRGGETRNQYHHLVDVAPTIFELAGIEVPAEIRGVKQMPIEGASMAYCFDDPDLPSERTTQYYEMLGHRGIYHDGWKAVTLHVPKSSYDDEPWMLYHLDTDFAENHDLAAEQPDKLEELKQIWWDEAKKFNVLPLDDRGMELFTLRRPGSELNRNEMLFRLGSDRVDRFAMPDIRNRSWQMRAEFDLVGGELPEGVMVAGGGRTGGYSMFLSDGAASFAYNRAGTITTLSARMPAPTGSRAAVAARFTKSADFTGVLELVVGDDVLAACDLETLPWRQTLSGLDIGADNGSTVTDAYAAPFAFTGTDLTVRFVLQNDRSDLIEAAKVEARNSLMDQ